VKPTDAPVTPFRARALALGLLLTVINAYWVGIASELWYAVYTLVSPFSNAIFTLAVLLGLNGLLKRWAPVAAFTPREMLLSYIMVTMVSTISGHAMMAIFMGTLAHPFWFASPENQYVELFARLIPQWLTVTDPLLLTGYFDGESSLYAGRHMRAWLVPVAFWSLFITAVYGSLLCVGLILRRQWAEREKLSFPLTHLPLQMTTNGTFWRSRALWIGIGIAGSVRLLAGVHDLFPFVPGFPANFRLDPFLRDRPWNAIGYVSMSYNFAIVGLAYFMPLDLAFSCWFFFWLTRAERVFAAVAGWEDLHLNDRATGGWIGVAVIALWTGRRHIAAVARSACGRGERIDAGEPVGYRTLTILTVVSSAAVVAMCVMVGMSLWVVVCWYALFLAFALALGHVRAALGPPYHEVIGINPRQMMVDIFGTRRIGAQNLTSLTFVYAFNRCNRSHPMPNQVEALRIGERSGIPGSRLVWAMALAIGLGCVATFWSYLHFSYEGGVAAKFRGHVGNFGWESWDPVARWVLSPVAPDAQGMGFMVGGFAFVTFLQFMRARLLWWPLHASGYVLSGASWGGMIYFWFPVMVSWLLKFVILKFAGLPAYRRAMPFFLGLVLGDFIPRSILSVVSLALNVYMPSSGSGHTL
jgi:hypothetical protein